MRSARSTLLLALLLLPFALPIAAAQTETPSARPDAGAPQDDLSAGHRDLDSVKRDPAEPGREWWREMIGRFPACRMLSDNCQSCARDGETLTCSTPGIACLRGEWRCVTTEDLGKEGINRKTPNNPREVPSSAPPGEPPADPPKP